MGGNGRAGLTILVVEDHADTRVLLRRLLELYGYGVSEASDGEQAVATIRRACPDLILMDLNLPLLGGAEATRAIRQIKGLCPVPVIAMTAHHTPEYRREAMLSGCNDYATKPLDMDALVSKVEGLLRAGRVTRLAEGMAATLHSP